MNDFSLRFDDFLKTRLFQIMMTQLQAEDVLLAFALAITLIRHKHVGSGVQFHPDDLATEVNSLKWGDNVDLQLNTSALQQALFKFKKVIRNEFLCLDELVVMGRTKYGPDLTPAFGDYASKKSGYEIKWNSSYEFAEEQSTTDLDLFELVGKVRTCRDHILQRAGLAPSCLLLSTISRSVRKGTTFYRYQLTASCSRCGERCLGK
jgi:hypothetical protein